MCGSVGAQNFAKILSAFPGLSDVRFSATRAQPEGCIDIAKVLGTLENLRKLDLCDNTFGTEGAAILGESLAKHVSFTSHSITYFHSYSLCYYSLVLFLLTFVMLV